MSEIERLRVDGVNYGYFAKDQLSNGQSISIFFLEYKTSRNIEFHIALAIANRKRHIKEWITGERDVLSLKSTGDCGLEGLIWAKKKISEFEAYIADRHAKSWYSKNTKITIVVGATDARRKRAYTHGLKKLGFVTGYRSNMQCLYKKIA